VFARTFTPGDGFGEPFEIDQTDVGCEDISVAMNAAGEAIVTWTELRGAAEEVWARRLSAGELAASAERVDALAANIDGTVSAVSATGRPFFGVLPGPEPIPPIGSSSTMVFHSPQFSHLPAQRL
jgi:hypothetical protein